MPTKTPSIISTFITVILLLLFGIASIFFLLVALNGFSERDGGPGLLTTLICNILGIIIAAIAAWKLPAWLINRFNWNSIVAVIVSTFVGFLFGSGMSVVAMFLGVLIADQVAKSR